MSRFHQPVLLNEVIKYLAVKKNGKYIDATVGGGGHSKAICQLGGQILGLDCDPEALNSAREYLSSFALQNGASEGLKSTACPSRSVYMNVTNASWRLLSGNFKDLAKIVAEAGWVKVDGILFDLGVSSHQLESLERGFSFRSEAPLDMRMDPTLTVTAADLINGLTGKELEKLFWEMSEEYRFKRLARAIVEARRLKPIKTGQELVEIIIKAVGDRGKIHPATRVFQALRIVVNDELNNLRQALPQALSILSKDGRLVVISFHSGEDRIVKKFFKQMTDERKLEIITKKPIGPTLEEQKLNPRSRSAKLRAAKRTDD